MVSAGTYPLWRELALSEDLPKEALKTVIEALCTPTTSNGFDSHTERWRENALKAALAVSAARRADSRERTRPANGSS